MKLKILIVFFLLFINMGVNAENISVDIGYPVVDQMEAKVLGTAYPQENIYQRLDRLETKVFGNVTQASLSDRVDSLRDTVLGKTAVNSAPVEDYVPPTMMYTQNPQSSEEYKIILYELEKKLLGTVYLTEPMDIRVTRLENKVFASSSDDYPMPERIQRLCAYADAQKSSQYYDDQAQLRQYNNIATGARIISLLFMILQAFL